MPRRIFHIIDTLDLGGAEKQLALLTLGLDRQQYEHHVCALSRGGERERTLLEAGIPVDVLSRRWPVDPLALARLLRHVGKIGPDIVHTWGNEPGLYGRCAAALARTPCLVCGELRSRPRKSRLAWTIDRCLANGVDRLVTNSTNVRDEYEERGIAPDRLAVIRRGVPWAQSGQVSRCQLLAELELPADARLIGAIGRQVARERLVDLIWAADLLRVPHDNMRLLVIGDGPQRPQLERFARLASDLDHIRFLGRRDDVARIVPHLDVLWHGSAQGEQPSAVMEAMAAGVPVVVSDLAGHRDLVRHGESGFLVPVAARAARVRLTDQILDQPQLAARLGAAARAHMAEQFSVDRMVSSYANLYREVLGDT